MAPPGCQQEEGVGADYADDVDKSRGSLLSSPRLPTATSPDDAFGYSRSEGY
jgi:hypothetical protein